MYNPWAADLAHRKLKNFATVHPVRLMYSTNHNHCPPLAWQASAPSSAFCFASLLPHSPDVCSSRSRKFYNPSPPPSHTGKERGRPPAPPKGRPRRSHGVATAGTSRHLLRHPLSHRGRVWPPPPAGAGRDDPRATQRKILPDHPHPPEPPTRKWGSKFGRG